MSLRRGTYRKEAPRRTDGGEIGVNMRSASYAFSEGKWAGVAAEFEQGLTCDRRFSYCRRESRSVDPPNFQGASVTCRIRRAPKVAC